MDGRDVGGWAMVREIIRNHVLICSMVSRARFRLSWAQGNKPQWTSSPNIKIWGGEGPCDSPNRYERVDSPNTSIPSWRQSLGSLLCNVFHSSRRSLELLSVLMLCVIS